MQTLNKTRIFVLLGGSISILLLTLIFLLLNSPGTRPGIATESPDIDQLVDKEPRPTDAIINRSKGKIARTELPRAALSLPKLRARDKDIADSASGLRDSYPPKVVEWLHVAGFSSPETDELLWPLSEDELQGQIDAGVLQAYEVLAFKQIRGGAVDSGVQTLREGVLVGSIAAASYLGDLYENDAYGLSRDDVDAYAWYRVARSMGEIASGMMGKGLGIGLGWQAEDYVLAEMYFMFLLAELNEESRAAGGDGLVYIPQPTWSGD